MKFSISEYIQFLDTVMAECGPVNCLTSASNAVTRRAKASYFQEREALLSMALRSNVVEFSVDVFEMLWPKLCKRKKYGILQNEYAAPKKEHDLRFPQDGRLVPGYAKDALAQLRTLAACVAAID